MIHFAFRRERLNFTPQMGTNYNISTYRCPMLARILPLFVSGFLILSLARADVHMESGVQQQIMLELYTSEGCSSCPPAEKYLNQFYQHPQLWKPFIPLTFHVDYWDYLGWRDEYAKPEYSQRQRQYAKVLSARTIYTPEFFVNGREWRFGFYQRLPQPDVVNAGNLVVDIRGQALKASFRPIDSRTPTELNIALLGMDITSHIRAGENTGRYSQHQFVVLDHRTISGSNHRWQTLLPVMHEYVIKPTAIVVWVSELNSPIPLQAVGGFLQ
ncbi:MAG: DUF1223 domain-containing protein [Gammaproteobacteria bacterium]|nr:MAG: DUF1223 domain-containing protein [Gammaproteobacteria bacterium]